MKESVMLFFIPFFYYTFASDSTTQCSGIENYKPVVCHCLPVYFFLFIASEMNEQNNTCKSL